MTDDPRAQDMEDDLADACRERDEMEKAFRQAAKDVEKARGRLVAYRLSSVAAFHEPVKVQRALNDIRAT